jgi:GDPmannose 4,6-dehydratase
VFLCAKIWGLTVCVPCSWEGEADKEVGKDAATGKVIVRVDPAYYRPTEVDQLLGNPAKAKAQLGWQASVHFDDLVREMVEEDLKICTVDPDRAF